MPHIRGLPDRLLLHIDAVDAEHQALAEVLDRVSELTGILAKVSDEDLTGVDLPSLADCLGREPEHLCEEHVYEGALNLLEELEQLTVEHFMSEERLMADAGYPELGTHRSEHMMLMAELAEFIREIRDDRKCLQQCHLTALKGWFFGHIALADKAFGDFYSSRK